MMLQWYNGSGRWMLSRPTNLIHKTKVQTHRVIVDIPSEKGRKQFVATPCTHLWADVTEKQQRL